MIVFHKSVNKIVFTLALCLLSAGAQAQRTSSGQGMLSFEGQWPHGASVSAGGYLASSLWEAGAFAQWRCAHLDAYDMEYLPAAAFGDWMYRLCGTRSRALNLYAGAGVFLGWEFFDPRGTLPETVLEETGSGVFLYGALAKIQLEIFFSRTVALILSGMAPFNFSSPYSWIEPVGTFGLRIDL